MSIGQIIALCPSCDASLSISESALYGNRGNVRCGKCRVVFYAPDRLLKGIYDESKEENYSASDNALTAYADGLVTAVLPAASTDHTNAMEATHISDSIADPHSSNANKGSFYHDLGAKEKLSQSEVYQGMPEEQTGGNAVYTQQADHIAGNMAGDRHAKEGHRSIYEDGHAKEGHRSNRSIYEDVAHNNSGVRTPYSHRPHAYHGDYVHGDYVNVRTSRRYRTSSIMWSFFSILLAILLCGQYLWVKRGTLHDQEVFRPLYHVLCNFAPCKIRAYKNFDKIDIKITMNKQEEIVGSLSNRAIFSGTIVNNAFVEQKLPLLVVNFFDTNKSIVSQQTLSPVEYLKNKELLFMPVKVFVQVEFSTDIPYNMYAYSVEAASPS